MRVIMQLKAAALQVVLKMVDVFGISNSLRSCLAGGFLLYQVVNVLFNAVKFGHLTWETHEAASCGQTKNCSFF